MTALPITAAPPSARAYERIATREVVATLMPRVKRPADRWKYLTISADFSPVEDKRPAVSAKLMPHRVYAHYGPQSDPANPPLPDAHGWSSALAVAIVEVLMGLRPSEQLQRWVAKDLQVLLERRCQLNTRLAGDPGRSYRPQLVSTRVCQLRKDLVETTHVVRHRGRTRAVALRMEGFRRQWLATAIEII